jgi:hypothetical protein
VRTGEDAIYADELAEDAVLTFTLRLRRAGRGTPVASICS